VSNPFIENLKKYIPAFISKNPKTSILLGLLSILFIFFLLLPQLSDSWKVTTELFSNNDDTNKDVIEYWLKKEFSDTTYNVLLLPFNDYQEDTTKKIKIERALEQHINELKDKYLFNSKVSSTIRIKSYLEIPEFLSLDSIRSIGNRVNADIIIYGDLYDLYYKTSKRTNIKYIILRKTARYSPFRENGQTGLIEFNSLDEIREGSIIKNIDYLIFWLFCNEKLFFKYVDDAKVICEKIITNYNEKIFDKNNALLCGFIGYDLYHLRRLEEAKFFLQRSIGYQEYAEILSLLGVVYKEQNLLDSSKLVQTKAYSINPNSVMVNVNLANYYTDVKQFVDAVYHYKKAIKINKNDITANFNLGLLYGKILLQPDSAYTYFIEALKLSPDSSSKIYMSIANSFNPLNFDSSLFYYKKALIESPKNPEVYYNIGVLYFDFMKFPQAKSNFVTAVKLNSKYSEAYNYLGLIYMNYNKWYDSASTHFNLAIKYDKLNGKAYYNLGLLNYKYLNHIKLGKDYLYNSISILPDFYDPYLALGDIYIDYYQNWDSARYCYEQTIKLDPLNAPAYNNLASLLFNHFSKYKLAASYYETAIKLNPALGEAYVNYADLLATKLNNKAKAKKYYEKAISIDEKFRDKKLEERIYKSH
jgi:tetratricopeptide (TPR) repeat protein